MSRKVIGCGIEVHKILGPGYDADVYLKALCLELDEEEVSYQLNHSFDVDFDGDIVGQTVATMYVGERFLVEVLARVGEVGSAAEACPARRGRGPVNPTRLTAIRESWLGSGGPRGEGGLLGVAGCIAGRGINGVSDQKL